MLYIYYIYFLLNIHITFCCYNSKIQKKIPTNKQRRNPLASPNNTKQNILPPYYLLCKVPGKVSLPLTKWAHLIVFIEIGLHGWELQVLNSPFSKQCWPSAPKGENFLMFLYGPQISLTEEVMEGFWGVVCFIHHMPKKFSHTTSKLNLNLLVRLPVPFPNTLHLCSMCKSYLAVSQNLILLSTLLLFLDRTWYPLSLWRKTMTSIASLEWAHINCNKKVWY